MSWLDFRLSRNRTRPDQIRERVFALECGDVVHTRPRAGLVRRCRQPLGLVLVFGISVSMSAVFDRTSFGGKMKEAEPYWWETGLSSEQKRASGDPKNRIGHMERTKARINADEAQHPDNVFGPEIAA